MNKDRVLEEFNQFKENQPDSAYVWLAKKVSNI